VHTAAKGVAGTVCVCPLLLAMRNLSSASWNTTPSEVGLALAELARSRFTPTTSYGGRSDALRTVRGPAPRIAPKAGSAPP